MARKKRHHQKEFHAKSKKYTNVAFECDGEICEAGLQTDGKVPMDQAYRELIEYVKKKMDIGDNMDAHIVVSAKDPSFSDIQGKQLDGITRSHYDALIHRYGETPFLRLILTKVVKEGPKYAIHTDVLSEEELKMAAFREEIMTIFKNIEHLVEKCITRVHAPQKEDHHAERAFKEWRVDPCRVRRTIAAVIHTDKVTNALKKVFKMAGVRMSSADIIEILLRDLMEKFKTSVHLPHHQHEKMMSFCIDFCKVGSCIKSFVDCIFCCKKKRRCPPIHVPKCCEDEPEPICCDEPEPICCDEQPPPPRPVIRCEEAPLVCPPVVPHCLVGCERRRMIRGPCPESRPQREKRKRCEYIECCKAAEYNNAYQFPDIHQKQTCQSPFTIAEEKVKEKVKATASDFFYSGKSKRFYQERMRRQMEANDDGPEEVEDEFFDIIDDVVDADDPNDQGVPMPIEARVGAFSNIRDLHDHHANFDDLDMPVDFGEESSSEVIY